MNFETGDLVFAPLFGKGIVIESYGEKVIVNFENKTFWLRSVSKDIFTVDPKRLTKKKDIKIDQEERLWNENHKDDEFIPNDML